MKTSILTLALSFMTLAAVAQKKEVRQAGKAVDKGNFSEAKNLLQQAEPNVDDLNKRFTTNFYLYKGQAYLGDGENVSTEELLTAADAFEKAQELGSNEAEEGLANVRNTLVQSAVSDQETEDYESAAEKLYTAYQLNKQDTSYLYYAAANSLNAQDYDQALEYYEDLKEMDYSGGGVEYIATNTETGEADVFGSEDERDLMVKAGSHEDPAEREIPSKRGEIAKNIALIYIHNEEEDKALEAMQDAKRENPDDVSLIQAEADMYYRMDNIEKYTELMEEVVERNPDNPSVYYNLGVSAQQLGDDEAALDYYQKAVELDPDMDEAEMNIAALILGREREIIDQMNELGTSAEDNERYDELAEERKEVYADALPYLERIIEKNPDNLDAIKTARNIYTQIGEQEKADEMGELLEQRQQ